MELLKDKLYRFRQWQEQPFEFKLKSDEVQHCNNCGNDYTGNFCPICSQKAGMGRINWQSVRSGIMDIWGLGTRSLLYSIWQLLLRPGHLIGDYIDGKRQVSFPPVKMLFIVAVVYSMFYYWLLPDVLGFSITKTQYYDYDKGVRAFDDFMNWSKNNYSWFSLFMALLAVVPTWFMFRYAPRHTAHTLPEGFFIQVFLAVLMVVLGFLIIPLAAVDYFVYSFLILLLYGVYYIIVYMYLFGYGLWGTLWRCGFVYITVMLLVSSAMLFAFDIDMNALIRGAEMSETQETYFRYGYSAACLLWAVIVFTTGLVINYIVTRKARKQLKLQKLQKQ